MTNRKQILLAALSVLLVSPLIAQARDQEISDLLTRLDCSAISLMRMSDEDGGQSKLVLNEMVDGIQIRYAVQSVTLSEFTPLNLTLRASDLMGNQLILIENLDPRALAAERDAVVTKVGGSVSTAMTRCSAQINL